jgi:urea transporter
MARKRLSARPLDASTTTMQTNTWFAIIAGLSFGSTPMTKIKLVPNNCISVTRFRYSENVIIQTI